MMMSWRRAARSEGRRSLVQWLIRAHADTVMVHSRLRGLWWDERSPLLVREELRRQAIVNELAELSDSLESSIFELSGKSVKLDPRRAGVRSGFADAAVTRTLRAVAADTRQMLRGLTSARAAALQAEDARGTVLLERLRVAYADILTWLEPVLERDEGVN